MHDRAGLPVRRRRPEGGRGRPDGAAGDGLQVRSARDDRPTFAPVARASDLPIMVYNNPVSYSVDITPEMFVDLADEPKLVAIKESSENVRRITDLKNLCGDRYRLFCGVDDLVLESVLLGAVGWVSGLVNAFPAENRLLWDLATSGRYEEALRVYRWYTPLLHLDTHVKLVQYIKLAMAESGLGSEMVRAPRLPLVGRSVKRSWRSSERPSEPVPPGRLHFEEWPNEDQADPCLSGRPAAARGQLQVVGRQVGVGVRQHGRRGRDR